MTVVMKVALLWDGAAPPSAIVTVRPGVTLRGCSSR